MNRTSLIYIYIIYVYLHHAEDFSLWNYIPIHYVVPIRLDHMIASRRCILSDYISIWFFFNLRFKIKSEKNQAAFPFSKRYWIFLSNFNLTFLDESYRLLIASDIPLLMIPEALHVLFFIFPSRRTKCFQHKNKKPKLHSDPPTPTPTPTLS